jgi:GNAT superfamily N-acetyltransferase
MTVRIRPLRAEELPIFKREMQKAFQTGAEEELGDVGVEILPESDIDRSLSSPGAEAFVASDDGQLCGGAIVVTDGRHGHLDFLFVNDGQQGRGIGRSIWAEMERLHPHTDVWETCTPYFEKRNIHFYINCCGFRAVEFYNPCHRDPSCDKRCDEGRGLDCMFRFEKRIRRHRGQ